MTIHLLPCYAGLSHSLNFALQLGQFPQLDICDVEGEEWRGFSGELFAGPTVLGSLRWDLICLEGAAEANWINPHLDKRSAYAVEKSGDLTLGVIRGGAVLQVQSGVEVQPQVGYSWMHLGGQLELLDRQTGDRYLAVDYSRWDRGPVLGFDTYFGHSVDTPGSRVGYPRLHFSYQYTTALGGTHMGGVEFQFSERHNHLAGERATLLLFARLRAGPSVRAVLVGAGASWGSL